MLADWVGEIAAFGGRIHGAAMLSSLMDRQGALAQVAPAAFILPLGITGGQPDAVSGLFRQPVVWLEGVLIVTRAAGDPTGAAQLAQLAPLINQVIDAVCGRSPEEGGFGVYRLVKGELVSLAGGALSYQLDFSIDDQLRITR